MDPNGPNPVVTGAGLTGSLNPPTGSVIEANTPAQAIGDLATAAGQNGPYHTVVIGDHGNASGQQIGNQLLTPAMLAGPLGDQLAGSIAQNGTLVLTGCNVGSQPMQDALQQWMDSHPNIGSVTVSTGDTYWPGNGNPPTGNWITLVPTPS